MRIYWLNLSLFLIGETGVGVVTHWSVPAMLWTLVASIHITLKRTAYEPFAPIDR